MDGLAEVVAWEGLRLALHAVSGVGRMRREHTNVGLAKEPATLGGGRRRRWVLDLRGGGSARLAHGVGAVHDGGVVVVGGEVYVVVD